MAKSRMPRQKPRHQRSDIPYADRLLAQRHNTLAEHRNEAAATALKLACVALNESEGLGLQRLTRFAAELRRLIDEYYSDVEVGEEHLNKRLGQMGFLVVDGRVLIVKEQDALLPNEFGKGEGDGL